MPTKQKVADLGRYRVLYRDVDSGIAWVENGRAGLGHTCHPNIDGSGSVAGLISRGWWKRDDRKIRSHGFIYNVDQFILSDILDFVAACHCTCPGCLEWANENPGKAQGVRERRSSLVSLLQKEEDPAAELLLPEISRQLLPRKGHARE